MIQWRDYRLILDIIKALRPDPKLYQEALEIFYSVCTCSISSNNKDEVMEMPRSVINRATILYLFYGQVVPR